MIQMSDYADFLRWREQRNNAGFAHVPMEVIQPAAGSSVAAPLLQIEPAPAKKDVVLQMEPIEQRERLKTSINSLKSSKLGESYAALDEEAHKDAKYLKLSQTRTSKPVSFAWRNVTMKVPIKEGGFMGLFERKTGRDKAIIDNVSGFIEPGQVLYIMGPSGGVFDVAVESFF
jgi:ABC-type glutathione transport system ATPase component